MRARPGLTVKFNQILCVSGRRQGLCQLCPPPRHGDNPTSFRCPDGFPFRLAENSLLVPRGDYLERVSERREGQV